MKSDYTRVLVLEDPIINTKLTLQESVVGKMQSVEALSYWCHKINPSPVVMDWLVNGVPLFPKGALVLALQPVPNQYVLSNEQVDSTAYYRRKGNSYNNSSQVGLSKMVANSDAYAHRLYSFAPVQNAFVRGCSGVVEPWKNLSWQFLAVRRLDKAWELFKNFCKLMSLIPLPSEVDTLVSFMVWLDLTHSFSVCADVLAAVARGHLEAQLPDPSKEYRVRRVYKALLKEYRKDKEPKWPCDPLPVFALNFYGNDIMYSLWEIVVLNVFLY
ncbi:12880_t:CDS:2 [Gigaspora margarita]|uniref:12880_t:CDS:1 n=1 Tax=Gigaspora margarita TaxID=4874 RepID=A0ABN7VA61_GIGMA|nr:12880_t:CDS:2 [Gigaspora margarita]